MTMNLSKRGSGGTLGHWKQLSQVCMTTEAETHTMMMMMLFVLNGDNDDREENRKMWILHITGADMTTNRIPTFFSCFPFSSCYFDCWKVLLDRQLWWKGGIAASLPWYYCCCLLFLSWVFFGRKKGRKVAARRVWGQSTNGPLSVSLRKEQSTSTFLGNGNIWLIFIHAFSYLRFKISLHLFLYFFVLSRRLEI